MVIVALLFMEWRSALLGGNVDPDHGGNDTRHSARCSESTFSRFRSRRLIIALGLLVDDPVVAGDAINREIAHGVPAAVAAWLGPQKLSRAILYATVTNCVAFLPLLLVTGIVGEFIYSLPVVVTASLVASRLVSMTFIPLLGSYLLRGQLGMEAGHCRGGKSSRFARMYNGFSEWCMEHKWASLACCLVVLGGALSLLPLIGTNFFPKDLHNVLTVNMFLAEGTPIRQTKAEAMKTIETIERSDRPGGRRLHDLRRRRRAAVLAVDRARAARGQLRSDPGAHPLSPGRPRPWPCGSSESCRPWCRRLGWSSSRSKPARRSACPCRSASRAKTWQRSSASANRSRDSCANSPAAPTSRTIGTRRSSSLRLQVDTDRANLAGITHQDVASLMGGGLSRHGHDPDPSSATG